MSMSSVRICVEPSYRAATPRAGFEKIYGLDGLRLISVLIVLIRHFDISDKVPGGFGVSVFFFISGFLICRMLLAEELETGGIGLRAFYIRRFIRLLPPLVLMGIITIPILLKLYPDSFSWAQVISAFAYLGNIQTIIVRLYDLPDGLTAYEPLWSLAVEEHFYLLLPLLLMFVHDLQRRIWLVFLLGCLPPLLLRFSFAMLLTPEHADIINYRFTFTRIDAMAWGVLATLCLEAGWIRTDMFSRLGHFLIWGGALACLLSLLHWSEFYEVALKYTPQTLAISCSVLGVLFSPQYDWLRSALEWKPVAFLGKASYEIYLWHLPIFAVVTYYVKDSVIAITLSFMLTLMISAIAYKIVSNSVHHMRQKYGSRMQ